MVLLALAESFSIASALGGVKKCTMRFLRQFHHPKKNC